MNFYEKEVLESRYNKVVKHNAIVQNSRFDLSATEQKTINFLISLVKPKQNENDIQPIEYEFEIQDYCKVCGIDYKTGENYKMVRNTLKSLVSKVVVVTLPDGTETSVNWINKFWSNKGSGKAKIRFDEDLAPYIFELRENTTRFELLNILPMKSKYSVRMYEICRSYCYQKSHTFDLVELRKMLEIPENELTRYPDFRRRVLEKSQEEINRYSDLNIYFEPIKKGRSMVKIQIHITEKDVANKVNTHNNDNYELDYGKD